MAAVLAVRTRSWMEGFTPEGDSVSLTLKYGTIWREYFHPWYFTNIIKSMHLASHPPSKNTAVGRETTQDKEWSWWWYIFIVVLVIVSVVNLVVLYIHSDPGCGIHIIVIMVVAYIHPGHVFIVFSLGIVTLAREHLLSPFDLAQSDFSKWFNCAWVSPFQTIVAEEPLKLHSLVSIPEQQQQ